MIILNRRDELGLHGELYLAVAEGVAMLANYSRPPDSPARQDPDTWWKTIVARSSPHTLALIHRLEEWDAEVKPGNPDIAYGITFAESTLVPDGILRFSHPGIMIPIDVVFIFENDLFP